jgi:hypothetical protein
MLEYLTPGLLNPRERRRYARRGLVHNGAFQGPIPDAAFRLRHYPHYTALLIAVSRSQELVLTMDNYEYGAHVYSPFNLENYLTDEE